MVKRKLSMLVLSFLLVFSSFQHASIVIAEGIDALLPDGLEEEFVSNEDNGVSKVETEEEDLEEEFLEEDDNEEEHEKNESDQLGEAEENKNESLAGAEKKEQAEEVGEEVKEEETEEINEDSLQLTMMSGSVVIEENIISSVQLFHVDEDGELVEVPQPMPHPAEEVLDLAILFEWELFDQSGETNHGYSAGATFTFQLPDVFVVYNEVSGQLLTDGVGSVGTYVLSEDGTVTMTFNENIEDRYGVKGTLQFFTEISQDIDGDLEQTINFVIRDQEIGSFPISFKSNVESSVEKSGVTDRSYNAQTITWEIDFNKSLDTIENAVLRDPIEEGQEADLSTIRLYELKVNLAGEVSKGDVVDSNLYEVIPNENGFDLVFNSEINSAYRLEFETVITDNVKEQFNNTATLDGSNIDEIPGSSSVSTQRGKPLEKRSIGYDGPNQIITWEIKLNYDEQTLTEDESTVVDWFDNAHELVLLDEEGNPLFEVFEIEINENGDEAESSVVPEGEYTLVLNSNEEKNGFLLSFNGGIDKAYKIVYRTKSVDRVFEGDTISNEVTFNENTERVNRGVSQQILRKSPTTNSVDYNEKTVEWRIVVNTDRHEMNSLTLKDTFTNKGLTLIEESFRIDGLNVDSYSLTNVNDEGFEVIFNEPINDPFTIVYTTEFDFEAREDLSRNNFPNGVELEWIDQYGAPREIAFQSVFTPDSFTQANGFKRGSYNAQTKEITWTIGVNYNLRNITEAIVRDYTLGNQELIPDSLEIYHGVLEGGTNQLIKGEPVNSEEYELNLPVEDADGNPGFSYSFNDPINTPFVIEYKTSLNDRLIEPSYHNVAYLNDGDDELVQLPATVGVHEGGTYTNKRGAQNGRVVNWEIDINSGQSTLTEAVVTDIPTPNQIIMADSFVLYPTDVAENGHLTVKRDEPLVVGEDYELEFLTDEEGTEYFELSFTETIERAYVLQYQTFIMATSGEIVSNDAKITSTVTDMPSDTNSSESIQVRITDGIGTGSGETGELTITKTDGEGVSLPGATFALYDETEAHRIRTGVTNENGELTFTNILYGNYVVKELEAPEGYLLRQESKTVRIDQDENELTFVNDKLLYEVELLKVDSYDERPLGGAQFELRRADQSVVGTYTTDDDGLIVVTDLEPGEYVFVEIQAPDGYADDQLAEVDFEITEDQIERASLKVGNEIKTGSVLLEKIDHTSRQVLEGAVFRLIDESGEIIENSLTTNEDGQIVVEDLRPGSYQFVEIVAPEDYELDSEPHVFEIVQSQEERLTLYAENRLIPGSVELLKVDDVTGEPLSGAVFDLETMDGELVIAGLVSNEEGHIVVTDLRPGEYRFVEIAAPDDYLLNRASLPFEIERSQAERLEVEFENGLIPGAVELTKVDDVTGEPLAGAVFNIVDADGEVVQQNLMTGESGRIVVDNLRPGHYQFVEVGAPEHYLLDDTPVPFEIRRSQETAVEVQVENQLIPGSVELVKIDVDTEQPLQGAIFRLEDGEGNVLEEELETDEEGQIVVEDLRPGEYQFVETKAPEHYQLATDPIIFTIEPSQAERLVVNAENQLILGDVQLLKIDDVDGTALAGAEFEIRTIDGQVVRDELVTNEEGIIFVSGLYPGEYRFVEVEAPMDYELDDTSLPFEIVFSQEETVLVTKENRLIPGAVELVKVDDLTGEAIEGAIFRLEDAEGNVLEEELETDEEGRIVVEDLRPGSYQFVETEAPEHYQLAAEPIEFTIEPSQTERLVVNAENQLILGDVQLLKIDDVDGTVLEGAAFELHTVDGQVVRTGLVTNEDGVIEVRDLYPGDYQFVEVKAPADYELDETPIPFTIAYSPEEVVEVTAENRLIPGSVELVKVDDVTGEKLEGAVFTVETSSGEVVHEDLVTDEEGRIVVDSLRPGHYQFVETSAPEHYVLDTTPLKFTIDRSQEEVLEVEFENRMIPGAVVLTKVDDVTEEKLDGAIFNLETVNGGLIEEGLETDENGQIIVEDLLPGQYRFVEVEAPTDYLLNPTPLEFEIERSQAKRLEITFENSLIQGAVEITKVDDVTGEPLAGAVFTIVNDDGDIVKENLMTGESGRIVVDSLRPGHYQLVEVISPEHYVLDETPIPFEIERSQEIAIEIKKENQLIPGSLELVKIDADTEKTLQGAIFRLEDLTGNVLEEELETDEDGRIVVEDIRPGSYQFVETKAPEHYQLADKPIEFTIELSQTERLVVNAENQLILGDVQLLKIDDVDGAVLKGAEYELQTMDGQVVRAGLVTNEDGVIEVRDLYPGEYQLVEVKAPADYELDETPIPFTIAYSQEEVVEVTAENRLTSGSVELVHVDYKSGEPLSGAVFNILNGNGEVIHEGLVTDEEGRIVVDHLRPGHYQFIEIKAPEHYQLNATPITFEIIRSQETTEQVTKESKLILGSVKVVKVDANTDIPLAGAIFQLENVEGEVLEENLVTDENGLIEINNLSPGNYQFVEVEAPEHYQLLTEAVEFTIAYSQEEPIQLVIENQPIQIDHPEKDDDRQGAPQDKRGTEKQEIEKKREKEDTEETKDERQLLPNTANPFIWTMLLLGTIALLVGMILLVSRRVYVNTRG